ncbi:MAG: glycosyltransferase [Silicimonas sp.]|nr:glycosyltransferase [Silicimonas sp.]
MRSLRRRTVIIMVKEPRPGRVKTRLGRDIGMVNAAWWYRHQTRTLLQRLHDLRWDILLAVAPDKARSSRVWPLDLPRVPQGPGDLGVRMVRTLATKRGPTLLIGSDIPAVRKTHIARAFKELRPGGSVVGPATDGGYWLVGLDHPRHQHPNLFKDVRWSSEHTLGDTLKNLPHPVGLADTLRDVDHAADLQFSSW